VFRINDSLYSLLGCCVDVPPYAFDTKLLPDVKELAPSLQLTLLHQILVEERPCTHLM
jgi:hypothetical protein